MHGVEVCTCRGGGCHGVEVCREEDVMCGGVQGGGCHGVKVCRGESCVEVCREDVMV